MGIVTGLLFLPVTGPVRAFQFLVERLHDEAVAVLRDEGRAFAELIDLSMRHGAGQLSDAEYQEQEAVLLGRLSTIRETRNELLQAGQELEMEQEIEPEMEQEDEGEAFAGDPPGAEPLVEEEVR